MLYWPNKDPDDVLDYTVDWTARLASSETISSHTITVTTGDVTVQSSSHSTNTVTVWLNGGTLDKQCYIQVRITTNQGRTMDQTVGLKIKAA